MKRWIQETNCYWLTFKRFHQAFEVFLLHWFNFVKSSNSFFNSISTDHFTECANSVWIKEHMFCSCKTNTLCSQFSCSLSICWSVSVCSNTKSFIFICQFHNTSKISTIWISWNCFDHAIVDFTCWTIKRQFIAFTISFASKCEAFIFFIHFDVATTWNTASSHSTSNNGCVRCLTTTNSKDTLWIFHSFNIFWACFQTNKNNFFALLTMFNCIFCCEHNVTSRSTWRSCNTFTNNVVFVSIFKCFCIKCWM